MQENIKKILEVAILAPSGENCQPWRFEVKENKIDIFNIPERDTSLYNFHQYGSYVAHGALIENILIASSAFGYITRIELFPNSKNINHTATILLEKVDPEEKELYSYIKKRVTNRKPFSKTKLTNEQKQGLENVVSQVSKGVELKLVDNPDQIKKLAKALTVSDRILFENKELHDFLFSHISWTKEESEQRKSGFYIKELELAPPQEKAFKLFTNWNILNFFNKIGFSKIAAKGNIKLYSSCAAIGIITAFSNEPRDFVIGGRAMQKVWLQAAKINLSIQPLTGIIFFMQRIFAGQAEQNFSKKHIELIKEAYKTISDVFDLKNRTAAMIFRIGIDGKPSAHSLRKLPKIIYSELDE